VFLIEPVITELKTFPAISVRPLTREVKHPHKFPIYYQTGKKKVVRPRPNKRIEVDTVEISCEGKERLSNER